MIRSPKIQFRVSRDMGQVYNTTFRFLRQNRSVLFKSVTFYIMPFILLAAFLVFNGIGSVITVAVGGWDGNGWNVAFSVLQGLFGLLIGYLAYSTYITLVYEYMRLYHQADDPSTITHREVWKATRQRFFIGFANVLVWGVLVSTLTGVVFVLFYICLFISLAISAIFNAPWLIVVMYVLLYIIEYCLVLYIQMFTFPMIFLSAMERVDIFTAFGRSFSMVNRRRNFWNAAGVTLVGILIMFILRYNVVAYPVGIIAAILEYMSLDPAQFQPGGTMFALIFKVFLPIFTLLYFYTFTVYLVAEGFEALSLDERVNAKGLLDKIEKLGTYRDAGPEFYEVTY